MARILKDGAEHGVLADRIASNGANTSVTTTNPRTGTYCYNLNDVNGWIQYPNFSAISESYIRFAYRCAGADSGVNTCALLSTGTTIFGMRVLATGISGSIGVYIGSTQKATATINIGTGAAEYHVFEIRVKINASGVIQVKYDGTQVINFSGDTTAAGTTFNQLRLSGNQGGSAHKMDDIALNDTSTASDNSWIGDGGVLAPLVPNGAGNYTDLIASAGSAYQCVDEIPQNGDTDYVYESLVNKKSTYTMTDVSGLPTGASIARVWVELAAKESAASGGNIATLVRSATTDSQGSDQALTIAYARYVSAEYVTDPADGTAWTPTKVNALEAGAVVR